MPCAGGIALWSPQWRGTPEQPRGNVTEKASNSCETHVLVDPNRNSDRTLLSRGYLWPFWRDRLGHRTCSGCQNLPVSGLRAQAFMSVTHNIAERAPPHTHTHTHTHLLTDNKSVESERLKISKHLSVFEDTPQCDTQWLSSEVLAFRRLFSSAQRSCCCWKW